MHELRRFGENLASKSTSTFACLSRIHENAVNIDVQTNHKEYVRVILLAEVCEIQEGGDVNGKLKKDAEDNVGVENRR